EGPSRHARRRSASGARLPPPVAPLTPDAACSSAAIEGRTDDPAPEIPMTTTRRSRSPEEVALIQAQLQEVADNPRRIARMMGRRELAGLDELPSDSRRPTDPGSAGRYVAENG